MGALIFVTILWALSFGLIGEFLAGRVDSDFAVLSRVLIAALIFLPFIRIKAVPAGLLVNILIWNLDADLGRLFMGGAVIAFSLWINARFHPRARLAV